MTITTATDLKNRLGAYLDAALTEPVFVQKSGRDIAVLLSRPQYERLQAAEDALWALRAQLAEQEGYLGVDATQQALHGLLQKDETCSPWTSPIPPTSSSMPSTPNPSGK